MSGFKNRFDILIDENEDPEDVVSTPSAPLTNKKDASNASKAASVAPKKPSASSNHPSNSVDNRKPQEGRPEKKNDPSAAAHSSERKGDRDSRPKSGRGGHAEGTRPGKREFDRHSGSNKTGVKPEEKRDGAGSYNWGKNDEEPQENRRRRPVKSAEEVVAVEPEEKQEETISYNEYKKKLEEERIKMALPAQRQPNEGSVRDKKWKNAVELVKEEEVFFAGKEPSKPKKVHSEKKSKEIVEIEWKFADSNQSASNFRGGRGGRGGFRGGRGGDSSARGGQNERTFLPNDHTAFPSLS